MNAIVKMQLALLCYYIAIINIILYYDFLEMQIYFCQMSE